MGEGQLRYNTEISNEYFYKYRTKFNVTPGLFYGDDRDTLFKSVTGLKYGLLAGVSSAVFKSAQTDAILLSNVPYNSFQHGLPGVFAGATYGVTVAMLAKVRGESDLWNHVVAGVASGQIIGGWYKNVTMGRWYSVVLALTGGMCKQLADNDLLIVDPRKGERPLNLYRTGLFGARPDPEGVKDTE